MKRENRLNRKREDRKKIPLKTGAYLIVTDAEKTEKNYFEGIKSTIPEILKNDLQIKIFSNKSLAKIIDFAAEERNKDERFRDVWLIFDRDEVKNFDTLIEEEKIYNILLEFGEEEKAIEKARVKYHTSKEEYRIPSKMIGCTTVYKLVEELKSKINCV